MDIQATLSLQEPLIQISAADDCEWITEEGHHICIKPGQNKGAAIKQYFDKFKKGYIKKHLAKGSYYQKSTKVHGYKGHVIVEAHSKWGGVEHHVSDTNGKLLGSYDEKREAEKKIDALTRPKDTSPVDVVKTTPRTFADAALKVVKSEGLKKIPDCEEEDTKECDKLSRVYRRLGLSEKDVKGYMRTMDMWEGDATGNPIRRAAQEVALGNVHSPLGKVLAIENALIRSKVGDKITLYRGIGDTYAERIANRVEKAGKATVKVNGADSWTTDKSTADDFGYVRLQMTVPSKYLVSSWKTNSILDGAEEGEFIVAFPHGRVSLSDANVTKREDSSDYYAAAEDDDDVIDLTGDVNWLKERRARKQQEQSQQPEEDAADDEDEPQSRSVNVDVKGGFEDVEMESKPIRPGTGKQIVKRGTQFCLISPNKQDQNFGCYPSLEQAKAVSQGKSFTQIGDQPMFAFGFAVKKLIHLHKPPVHKPPLGRGGIGHHRPNPSMPGGKGVGHRFPNPSLAAGAHNFSEDIDKQVDILHKAYKNVQWHMDWDNNMFLAPDEPDAEVGRDKYRDMVKKANENMLGGVVDTPRIIQSIRNIKKLKAFGDYGEPMSGALQHAHMDTNLWFHPPSLKKPDRVPTDDPKETNDKFLDVTKRKKAHKDRMKLLKRSAPGGLPALIPAHTTLLSPHQAVYVPGQLAAGSAIRRRNGGAFRAYGSAII